MTMALPSGRGNFAAFPLSFRAKRGICSSGAVPAAKCRFLASLGMTMAEYPPYGITHSNRCVRPRCHFAPMIDIRRSSPISALCGTALPLLLTLLATPVLYSIFDDVQEWFKRRRPARVEEEELVGDTVEA